MVDMNLWEIRVSLEDGSILAAQVHVNAGAFESENISVRLSDTAGAAGSEDEGVRTGRIRLEVKSETLSDTPFLEMNAPVRVDIPLREVPERITAYYLFNPWWTRPAFVSSVGKIPDRTQIALFQMKDRCICFLPMVGEKFKSYLKGSGKQSEPAGAGNPADSDLRSEPAGEGNLADSGLQSENMADTDEHVLHLQMTAYMGGLSSVDEPLYIMAEAPTADEAVHRVFAYYARQNGFRLRSGRRIPEMFRYLGWCSWDAFYTEITEEKVLQKAKELHEKDVPVRWMLMDDGWFGAKEKMLSTFAPDTEKFPNGFRPMIEEILRETKKGTNPGVTWFGIWHALGGYWDGVAPGSPAAQEEADYLFSSRAGKLLPDPKRAAGFYSDWYELLQREGIDFVKVDGQSAGPMYFKNAYPIAEAVRDINLALEKGACRMDNAVINCMGMAMENVLARPSSAISRNSDDFLPQKEESFAEHLLQNAYNAIYHNEIYCCDWDMFWTSHKHAVKHSLLRAISGGPVYVSDRIDETNPEVLRPLVYADGEVLMMARSARPTGDCIFTDPREQGVLKLHNYAEWGQSENAGGIAAYNLTDQAQTFTVSPAEIPELDAGRSYWMYDFFAGTVRALAPGETYEGNLPKDGFAWFIFLPQSAGGSCLGLIDKYVGFTAVEAMFSSEGGEDADAREVREGTVILRGSGNIAWISEKKPIRALADGKDVTANMKSKGLLHTLQLPERAGCCTVTVWWS